MDSTSLESDVEFVRENEIKNLILNGRGAFKIHNVDFLRSIGDLVEHIVLTPPAKSNFDFSGLRDCSALLHLKVNYSGKSVVDISHNERLQSISIDDCAHLKGLDKLSKIEKAILGKPPSTQWFNEVFSNKSELQTLSVSDIGFSDGLECLRSCPLEVLWFFRCKNVRFEGINWSTLRNLSVDQCTNFSGLDCLEKAMALEELRIIDSGPVDSVLSYLNLPALHTLIVLGSSYFIDGNLEPARQRLRDFRFGNRSHYSSQHEEFKRTGLVPIDQ